MPTYTWECRSKILHPCNCTEQVHHPFGCKPDLSRICQSVNWHLQYEGSDGRRISTWSLSPTHCRAGAEAAVALFMGHMIVWRFERDVLSVEGSNSSSPAWLRFKDVLSLPEGSPWATNHLRWSGLEPKTYRGIFQGLNLSQLPRLFSLSSLVCCSRIFPADIWMVWILDGATTGFQHMHLSANL